jgi:light-regulated signal transduction histidine kinase (bacteriophytochrome)
VVSPEAASPQPPEQWEAAAGDALVLIAEDDPVMKRFLSAVLSPEYHIHSASNGREAWELTQAHRPDLIVSDVWMPEMSGEELLRLVRGRPELDSVPLVMLTAKTDEAMRVRLLQAGAQDFLTKSVEVEELRARVRNLVQMKRAGDLMRSQVAGQSWDLEDLARQVRQLNLELERRVLERTAELEAANRELDAFCYSVSHDLRAPLRAMEGFAQVLLDDAGALPEETKRCLRIVQESAVRMSQLIDDLLAFSRLGRQPVQKSEVDPAQVARQAWEELAVEWLDREVEFRLGELSPCQADPSLLQQVFVNLLSNALKFSRVRRPAIIEVGGEGGRPVYWVKDNGVGFDRQCADRLFGVFQRFHSSTVYEGNGAGLAIVDRIVRRHGGRVWAEAAVGRGATFYFELAERRSGTLP